MKTMAKPYLKLELVQGSEEWRLERLKRVTGSNVSALFDLNPYKTKLQYFEELLLGEEPEITDSQRMLFEIGHSAEGKGRDYAEKTYGMKFPAMVLLAADLEDLMVSLDGFNEDHLITFEAKYVGRDVIKRMREEPGWIKPDHYCQVQAGLRVTGAKKCIYFAMDPDGEAATLEVLADPAYQLEITEAVKQFIADVRAGKAPEPSDRDWHEPNDPAFAELAEIKRKADEFEARLKKGREDLLSKYRGSPRLRGGGIMLYRSYVKGNVDYSKVPQLRNVNLDRYRKPGREQYTLKLTKKGAANE